MYGSCMYREMRIQFKIPFDSVCSRAKIRKRLKIWESVVKAPESYANVVAIHLMENFGYSIFKISHLQIQNESPTKV